MSDAIVLNTPDQIAFARLAALKGALFLETKGIRVTRGRTAYALLKEMGYRGNRAAVLAAVTEDVEHLIARAQAAKESGNVG